MSSGLSDGILKWTRWGSRWAQQVQQTEEQPPYKSYYRYIIGDFFLKDLKYESDCVLKQWKVLFLHDQTCFIF